MHRHRRRFLALLAGAVFLWSLVAAGLGAGPALATGSQDAFDQYGYPYFFAPDCNEGDRTDGCFPDHWAFIEGQCTSWVAYRLNERNGILFNNYYRQPLGQRWSDATLWAAAADRAGIVHDSRPAVGAVAWYPEGGLGHVAYVEEVQGNGTIVISEMNFDGHNGFRLLTVHRNGPHWPAQFIHVADR
jgi:hypothetical protein